MLKNKDGAENVCHQFEISSTIHYIENALSLTQVPMTLKIISQSINLDLNMACLNNVKHL